MLTEHVFTIDLGTSGPKVAIFTIDGVFVDGDSDAVTTRLTADGGAEQRPADWWSAIRAAAQRLVARARVPASSFVAVSVTSQWSGTVPI
ncbi:MAG: FGGY family carbohydrate kinase, partial [Acidimicrobiia bacterium]